MRSVESIKDISELYPMNENRTGASMATEILLMREYVANIVTDPPSIPVITGAAVAVGQNMHINVPCAISVLAGAMAMYTATAPIIWITSSIHMNLPM